MVDQNINVDGVVIYWSLTENFNRDRLLAGWKPIGLEADVPDERAKPACLRDALQEVFKGDKILIRPHAAKNGFSVVQESRGADDNSYSTLLTAKVYDNSALPTYAGDPARTAEISQAYLMALGRVPSSQITAALVKVLGKLGATRLRPTGGVYWLPGSRLNEWQSIMAAVEAAADGGVATGYTIRHSLDKDSVKAVQDAIVHEVHVEAKRLSEEILSGELGERAIKTRKAEAAALRDKVSEYEQLLGVGLGKLKAILDDVEQTNATAALLAAATLDTPPEEVSNVA